MFPLSDRENHFKISLRKNLYQNYTVVIIGMSEWGKFHVWNLIRLPANKPDITDITERSEPFREEPLDLAPLLPFLPWWMDAAKRWGGWDVEGWRLDVFGVISLGGAA